MRRNFVALFLSLWAAALLQGQTAEKIMWRVHNRPTFRDMHAFVTMRLIPPNGPERVRKMEVWSKTDPKTDETKMLIRFLEPADVRGTAFLIHSHKDREDDMWFYLPALRRVQRIAASGKAGAFMGSDFSNYDIGGGEYEDWTYTLLREDTLDGDPCWVIEARAKSPEVERKSGYSRMIRWVRKDNYLVLRTDHYDRSGELFKRTRILEARAFDGVWFETKMEAQDLDSGHRSIMEFSDITVNQGLPDDLFTKRSLKR